MLCVCLKGFRSISLSRSLLAALRRVAPKVTSAANFVPALCRAVSAATRRDECDCWFFRCGCWYIPPHSYSAGHRRGFIVIVSLCVLSIIINTRNRNRLQMVRARCEAINSMTLYFVRGDKQQHHHAITAANVWVMSSVVRRQVVPHNIHEM